MQIDAQQLWNEIVAHQGEIFYTAPKLPFTYVVRGGELFTNRKKKSITRATVERAYAWVEDDAAREIVGPKSLNVFGAPYIWAIFAALEIVDATARGRRSRRTEGQLSFLEGQTAQEPELPPD